MTVGGVAAVTTIVPERRRDRQQLGSRSRKLGDLPPGQVTTVLLNYEVKNGIYTEHVSTPVLISRLSDEIVCYKTACPHLGCTVHWDGPSDQFRCACHGGAFDRDGNVTAGPPPRPLDRYETQGRRRSAPGAAYEQTRSTASSARSATASAGRQRSARGSSRRFRRAPAGRRRSAR